MKCPQKIAELSSNNLSRYRVVVKSQSDTSRGILGQAVKPGRITIAWQTIGRFGAGHAKQYHEAAGFEGAAVMRYEAVIEKADGNYSAYVPDLPGCVAIGETCRQARRKSARRSVSISKGSRPTACQPRCRRALLITSRRRVR
jgi:hypothetical protein